MLKLWENPMLSLSDRLDVAGGEIERLRGLLDAAADNATRRGSMFDYETAANLCRGRNDKLREFASQARWAHDDRESLSRIIADLRRELAMREGEIAMLKDALLEHDEVVHNAAVSGRGETKPGEKAG